MDGQTDRHILLLLRVFDPVACSRMYCVQLRSAPFDHQKPNQTTGQRHRHILLIGIHWGPLDPTVGISTDMSSSISIIIAMSSIIAISIAMTSSIAISIAISSIISIIIVIISSITISVPVC